MSDFDVQQAERESNDDIAPTEKEESALRENIKSKGHNAYYYAHSNTATGPVWDGKEEPKLLSTSEVTADAAPKKLLILSAFESYSWSDGKKTVSIYIDFDAADKIDDEAINLSTTETSLEFRVSAHKEFALNIEALHGSLAGCVYKKKADKFVLSLKKAEEVAWNQLKRA